MTQQPIITNLADDDLYKLSMQQVIFHFYPNATGEYEFKCRNKDVQLGFLAKDLIQEIESWEKLRYTPEFIAWLRTKVIFKEDFLRYLLNYKLDTSAIYIANECGDLVIRVKGTWLNFIITEVLTLATVNELYFRSISNFNDLKESARDILRQQIEVIKKFPQLRISEFGTRRRYSQVWQEEVFTTLIREVPKNITGTSNMALAMKYGVPAHGTCAHEFFSAHMALAPRIEYANKFALAAWQMEYDNNLGTALTDTFTTDVFLRDFGHVYSRSYDSGRQDSGSPYVWGNKMLAHWRSKDIDPRLKAGIFTNSLNLLSEDPEESPVEIWKYFAGDMMVRFGIGTSFTNFMAPGWKALNIVMKLVKCNGMWVVKLSDDPGGKSMGHQPTVLETQRILGIAA